MKLSTIKIPIYHGELTLIKSKDFKKTNKKYKLNIPPRFGAVTFRNENVNGFEVVISFVDSNVSLIAHEAIHACNFIYENIGAKLDIQNDEHQAYITGWIVEEIEKFLAN